MSYLSPPLEKSPISLTDSGGTEYRVIVCAPSANDERITIEILGHQGVPAVGCASFADLPDEMTRGCGALIVADEALLNGKDVLARAIGRQPPWSDLPITVVASAGEQDRHELGVEVFASAGNVTVLERPFRPDTLVSTIKVALRARRRQYEVRDLMQRLQNSEVRVRGILESISDAFMTIDHSWYITYVNAACHELIAPLFPLTEELKGQPFWKKFPDLNGAPLGDYCRRAMNGARLPTMEIFYEPLMAWLEIRAYPSTQALSLYIRNITSRKAAEEALRLAKEKAEASSRSKDHFLAVLSHELRTPLTPVLMISSARATDAALPADVRDDMAMIRRNVELETKLIDDLLDLSRITTGKLHLHFQPVHVNDMVAQVCEICSSQIESQGLTLDLALCANVDGVYADTARFQQILWNVIKNAAKFTPRGGRITITTRLDEKTVVIEIRDTGIGIELEALPKIFDAFEQGDARRTQQFGGLGLGLAITQALITLHDGRISARSDGPGTGSTFIIELPSLTGEATAMPADALVPASANRASILLVEDHADTAVVLRSLLEQRGYTVIVATSVAEALAIADHTAFDILLSDIGLPDATGYQLVQTLKKSHAFRSIAMSGYGMEDDVKKSLAAGFDQHLVKPVNIVALETAIQNPGSA